MYPKIPLLPEHRTVSFSCYSIAFFLKKPSYSILCWILSGEFSIVGAHVPHLRIDLLCWVSDNERATKNSSEWWDSSKKSVIKCSVFLKS